MHFWAFTGVNKLVYYPEEENINEYFEDDRGQGLQILNLRWEWLPTRCRSWLERKLCVEVSHVSDTKRDKP